MEQKMINKNYDFLLNWNQNWTYWVLIQRSKTKLYSVPLSAFVSLLVISF